MIQYVVVIYGVLQDTIFANPSSESCEGRTEFLSYEPQSTRPDPSVPEVCKESKKDAKKVDVL